MKTKIFILVFVLSVVLFIPLIKGSAQELFIQKPNEITSFSDLINIKSFENDDSISDLATNRSEVNSTGRAIGGPDDFGYIWDESEPYEWIDVSGGTDTGLSVSNHVTGAISLPFNFMYYGNAYDHVYIQAHGSISFTDTTYSYTWSGESTIPDPDPPNNVIAPYWGPIFPSESGWVRYTSGGVTPNQYFVVEWYDLMFYPGNSFTFQMILHENGDIVFQYETMEIGGSVVCSMSGIENSSGSVGLAYLDFCGFPQDFSSVRFSIPIYVDSTATGNNNGSSWTDAYTDLQDALATSEYGDVIWVAAGTYKPTPTNDQTISFNLKSGVVLYGGFPSGGGDWESRNWVTNTTTLSGDIGTGYFDRSYHVVYSLNVDSFAVIDGFTITKGGAYVVEAGDWNDLGGGMLNINSNPQISNVIFLENDASDGGGGIYNYYSNPTLINVLFDNNGGGVLGGGGIYNWGSNPTIKDSAFINNVALITGGGILNNQSNPTLTNVTFSENLTDDNGGAISNFESAPTFINVTIYGNETLSGVGGGIENTNSSPILTNCIIWGNIPDQINNDGTSTPIITFSDIQGGYTGTGNIDADPLLGSLADNGGSTPTYALLEGSPAIDVIDPNNCPETDQRGFVRPIDGNEDGIALCDMGAYEYDAETAIYELNIYIFGLGGDVDISPDQPLYAIGDEVTLLANAQSGCVFDGWSGDVSGIENPLTVIITGDINIIATFVGENKIYLPLLLR